MVLEDSTIFFLALYKMELNVNTENGTQRMAHSEWHIENGTQRMA